MVTLRDLQAYADNLGCAPAIRIRAPAAVKPLLTFRQGTGILVLNVGAALKLPPRADTPGGAHPSMRPRSTPCSRASRTTATAPLRPRRAGLRIAEIARSCRRALHTLTVARRPFLARAGRTP